MALTTTKDLRVITKTSIDLSREWNRIVLDLDLVALVIVSIYELM